MCIRDRSYLAFADKFNGVLLDQRMDESRTLEDTLDRAWQVASALPERELTMMPAADIAAHYLGDRPGTPGTGAARPDPGQTPDPAVETERFDA